ncbi:MAG TPA: cell division FtsA domain-containing protein [Limnochordales bacterium]|nr:cell division FtsA domain-containing protein [Limnochordales bacterium]
MGSAAAPAAPRLVLDIGTHKVLGLAVRKRAGDGAGGVEVLASCFLRHHGRAMRDGQVHDVPAVARTLRRVKENLEAAVGVAFSHAHIAAAGRALHTVRGRAEQDHGSHTAITEEMNRLLEWEAVADAQLRLLASLEESGQRQGFYCIAHAPTGYWLDGDPIGRLMGQRGRRTGVEVLATFLPGAVVDSLEGALHQAGLEMAGLTLEPIAVLEAIVPDTMRHLNLALVDIGAGTSDIALTGDGTVQAFAMVPEAGDAITEAIARELLLDFTVAEHAKRQVSAGGSAVVENVLGEKVELTAPQLEEITRAAVQRLATRIAAEVAHWAQDPPAAVLLVGGGSQTPGLAAALASALDLAPARVSIRDRRAVRGVAGAGQLQGPDVITALGIALVGARGGNMPPVRVRVDGRPVCLFLPDRCTVREAARIAGLPLQRLAGRLGSGLTVTVNGELTVIPGTRGTAATVLVNNQPASLDTILQNQDEVQLGEPQDGEPPRVTVRDLVDQWLARQEAAGRGGPVRIQVENTWQDLPVLVRRNGHKAELDETIADRDQLEIRFPRTAAELVEALGRQVPAAAIRCLVNGAPVTCRSGAALLRNGEPASPDDPVRDGDRWDWEPGRPITVRDVLREAGLAVERTLHVTLNGQPVAVAAVADVRRNGVPAGLDEAVVDGDRLEVAGPETVPLYRLLPYAGIHPETLAQGRRVILEIDGRPAGYTAPVQEGDAIAIRFVPDDAAAGQGAPAPRLPAS